MTVLEAVFRRELVIVVDLIFVLLHVITSSCVDSLLIGLVRITTPISLLILLTNNLLIAKHAAQLTICHSIVSLLFHLLVELVES